MRRAWRIALIGLGVLTLVLLGQMGARYLGLLTPRDTPEERSALLSPYYKVYLPDSGQGPFPTALLASGCDGPHDNMARWAGMLNEQGWAAVMVDSHAPRDYLDFQVWRLICAGQIFTGTERAGDLAVALEDVRAMAFADPDRLLLFGASHGGWAVMDLLSQAATPRPPQGLTRWPGDPQARGLAGVLGALVSYPYCGPGSLAARQGWAAEIPVEMILVRDDEITDEQACLDIATGQTAVRPVAFTVLENATHGFDQQEREALSTLEFSPEATATALGLGRDFVTRISAPESAPGN
ncbi:dienelactone hydrolase family protein [Meridianimarinicoccus sp. MJW13]|uniref:dienelactone hydrolase family protein n=1 Tax=Meridianimarinicoccus sp. MJW13 TaxID=2720031 RepID=UPI00186900FD|nr:dienelactone hydrolase [Fluviibacterium sp. MJW13]